MNHLKSHGPRQLRHRGRGTVDPLFRGRRLVSLLCTALLLSACDSSQNPAPTDESASPGEQASVAAPAPSVEAGEEAADGRITASFDGESLTWYITSGERGGQYVSQSDWSPAFGSGATVSLMGHTSPTSTFQSAKAIMIGFTLQDMETNPQAVDASITYLSGGITANHSSSHDGSAEVSVDTAQVEGDNLTLSGSFSGTLPFKSLAGDADVESTEPIEVANGTFRGVVRKLQE